MGSVKSQMIRWQRSNELQQRVEDLEKDVDWLEKSLKGGIESASPSLVAKSSWPRLKNSDRSSVVSAGGNYAIFFIA